MLYLSFKIVREKFVMSKMLVNCFVKCEEFFVYENEWKICDIDNIGFVVEI